MEKEQPLINKMLEEMKSVLSTLGSPPPPIIYTDNIKLVKSVLGEAFEDVGVVWPLGYIYEANTDVEKLKAEIHLIQSIADKKLKDNVVLIFGDVIKWNSDYYPEGLVNKND